MNSLQRTLGFVVVAGVSVFVAYAASEFTKPVKLAEHEEFGKDFFTDFTDPSKASAIRVVTFDEATAVSKDFTVVNKDGWRIKSHNDYPADGKVQLAKAASSVISLKRGSLVTRRETEYERYGVIDPLDEKNTALKGRGTRITLLTAGDIPLADFIIGKKVEGSEDKRYLRRADEPKVYVVAMKFDVSTKFSDWAETNLLKLNGVDLVKLKASQPKYNDQDEFESVEVVELSRDKSADPWKLAGLDEATEELKVDEIATMVTTLSDLRLVGVRPKPEFKGTPVLGSDLRLRLPAELAANPQIKNEIVNYVKASLHEKGFFLGKGETGETQIVSREGELTSATKDGIVYRLTFGSVFSGTEEEIEAGTKEESGKSDEAATKKKSSKDKKKEDQKKSRYLFVRAEFDEKLLGEPPVEPVKPEPPPGVEAPADLKSDTDAKKPDADSKKEDAKKSDTPAKEPDADDKDEGKKEDKKPDAKESKTEKPAAEEKSDTPQGAQGDDKVAASDEAKPDAAKKEDEKKDPPADTKDEKAKPDDKPAEKKSDAEKPTDPQKTDEKKEEPQRDLKAEYFDALKRYDAAKGQFNTAVKVRESQIETGQAKVKELNDRFADWYYVISNDSFDKLRLNRASLLKSKEKAADKEAGDKKDDAKTDETKTESETKDDAKKDDAKKDEVKKDEVKKEGDAAKPADAEKPVDSK